MADTKRDSTNDPDLRQIREAYNYDTHLWEPIRAEAKTDMRYVSGDPWEDKDKEAREKAGRPLISPDELGQYFNQVINDVRQHKRAIKVTPQGNGANDKTAEFRANLYRQIEYRSNAQMAYTTMFENTVQRSYGFFRIKPQYVSDRSMDQELLIKTVINPDLVTPDGDAVEPDGSDMRRCIIEEEWRIKEFKRRFPKAKILDFTGDIKAQAPTWIREETLRLAEHWFLEAKKRTLIMLVGPNGQPIGAFDDELDEPKFQGLQMLKSKSGAVITREVDTHTVTMQLTNGVEILEETKFKATTIPLVPCYGKILYVGGKRILMSMTRLGRDPQMLYAYYRTQQAEMAGMIPKVPVIAYKGQFRGVENDWQKANHEPIAFLEANPTTEATGQQILPLPTRLAYEAGAHIQALEVCAEGARRAIQAAMGTSPLPSQAQRRNEKSGVALKQIDESFQAGSFHFVDHYEQAITRGGAILEDWVPYYYDAARDVTVRKPNDTTSIIRINDTDPQALPKGQTEPLMVGDEIHDVTLSTGPSNDSEREVANDLSDSLVQNIQMVAQVSGPKAASQVLASSIRLKNVGPLGDEMADIISPKEEKGQQIPPQVQQQLDQATAVLNANAETIKKLSDELKAEQDGNKVKLEIERMKGELEWRKATLQAQTSLAVAEIGAKSKADIAEMQKRIDILEAMIGAAKEIRLEHHTSAHDAAKMAAEHGHEARMADQEHERAKELGALTHEQNKELAAETTDSASA